MPGGRDVNFNQKFDGAPPTHACFAFGHASRADGRDRGTARPPGYAHDGKALRSSCAELRRRYHSDALSRLGYWRQDYCCTNQHGSRSSPQLNFGERGVPLIRSLIPYQPRRRKKKLLLATFGANSDHSTQLHSYFGICHKLAGSSPQLL